MANAIAPFESRTGLTRLPDVIDRLFNESFVLPSIFDRSMGTTRGMFPVNLVETPDAYVMQAALPGLKPEDVDIQVAGREVAIKGTFELTLPEGSLLWRGIPTGEFYETYTLPVEVASDSVEATYEHGILWLTLPKAEHVRPKTIKVSATK